MNQKSSPEGFPFKTPYYYILNMLQMTLNVDMAGNFYFVKVSASGGLLTLYTTPPLPTPYLAGWGA